MKLNMFKRAEKPVMTVSRAEYDRLEVAFNRVMSERDSYRDLLTDAEAKLARIYAPLIAANERRKAAARKPA